ncbi:MAG: tRNA-splicing ligase RtcB [Candidatus Methanogaster sp.]|nr:MAG: tRNA-splicing ligase RtcB [ANME-2 cluster archaeon]
MKEKGKMPELNRVTDNIWDIPVDYMEKMRVPGRLFLSPTLLKGLEIGTLSQIANVATLPGIQKYSMAMPDAHPGYGFPIGGVAAFDSEDGVISPGGVGFDINCLAGDAEVLHEHGYTVPISKFDARWDSERIKCMNFGTKPRNTGIDAFMELPTREKMYLLTTGSGESIKASAEHPFYTDRGMVRVKDLQEPGQKQEHRIAIFPFKGVEYEAPDSNVLVGVGDVRSLAINRTDMEPTVSELIKRDLLPLTADSGKLPYLLKIMGFLLGNGTMYFNGNEGTIRFYGVADDLEDIRLDIEKLGFTPSRIYSRTSDTKIGVEPQYLSVLFSREENSFKVTSSSLTALLACMGIPLGDKTTQEYLLPDWIFALRLWQKRLFLSSFFGAELSAPATMTGHGYNFYAPVLPLNKRERIIQNGEEFLDRISVLLLDFGIDSIRIGKRKGYVNKNGEVSHRLRLQIGGTAGNLIKLWSLVGFEYNQKRRHLAAAAVMYLRNKEQVIDERERVAQEAGRMRDSGEPLSLICSKLESVHVNKRFIERSLYEGRSSRSRVPASFRTFDAFRSESAIGTSGMVWDSIRSIEEIEYSGFVYDFMVQNEHHNFVANSFVVSNCGVRVIRTNLTENEVRPKIRKLVDALFRSVPSGVGAKSKLKVSDSELRSVFEDGAGWAVEQGYGVSEDLEHCEENGGIKLPGELMVSDKVMKRGRPQLGTLGSGNHFLEVQCVREIYDQDIADTFGIHKGDITIMIHCGSRGAGHQICTEHLRMLEKASRKYGIELVDRQLACAPVQSKEGQEYFTAMCAGANYAWANRQVITHWVRETFHRFFGDIEMDLVYDVAHNVAKLEEHTIDGRPTMVYVHRKGATRAFPSGHPDVPKAYRSVGQPVLIPGSMGTPSYILCGMERAMELTFGSACHGAGRVGSRKAALKKYKGAQIEKELLAKGITVKATHPSVLAEEAPAVYKSSADVVDVVHRLGVACKVAQVVPIGVAKG